jgi:hypothetical protein
MTTLDGLIEFTSARLDEWERRARAAFPHETGSRDEGQPAEWVSWRRGPGNAKFGLGQVEMWRSILADLKDASTDGLAWDDGTLYVLEQVTARFAALFAHHPDYRPEWAPRSARLCPSLPPMLYPEQHQPR